ncbi:MAG: hypothetical protein Q3968_05100 [Clostridiaceae bacterium]|nr:hypothetical protein [Clostridiaceae bacterium]
MIEQENILSLAGNVSNSEELWNYLKKKAKSHNNYKCYSTIDRIIDIRDNKILYLSNGKTWNDISDRSEFNSDDYQKVNFGKCFSFSQEENVAMWMLYGGIEKRSGMIDFTKKGIRALFFYAHKFANRLRLGMKVEIIRFKRLLILFICSGLHRGGAKGCIA